MTLQLYNSLSRQKEEFQPIEKDRVGVYVCGPTVYGHSHLGHAKSYVSFDVLVRYLRYLGYKVTYVQNITDVGHLTDDADDGDDKLTLVARQEKKHPMAVAEFYTHSFFEDMDRLNCLRPDISPRATGHIIEQIELIQTLIDKGFAYEANGSVYFEVSKCRDYGKLSGRNTEDMISGARVQVSPDKRNPVDFALWKKAEPNHIMQWPSPWGRGYPGWHLECSAMSMKYLGNTIDIHGGGLENKFPHHECEIAQSESANDAPFVKYWMHNNMVTMDGTKMGKSLNNFVTLKDVFSGHHERLRRAYEPLAVRQLILNSHYRSTLDFSDAALYAALSGYTRITDTVQALRRAIAKESNAQSNHGDETAEERRCDSAVQTQLDEIKTRFEGAMNDDLNTAVALAALFDQVRLTQDLLDESTPDRATLEAVERQFFDLGGDVLGIVTSPQTLGGSPQVQVGANHETLLDGLLQLLIEQRQAARRAKDFAKADQLREQLDALGIVLKDTPQGTQWSTK